MDRTEFLGLPTLETRMEPCRRSRPQTRRYPWRRRQRRSGWSARCEQSVGTEHGTVQRVASQLGYGVESVRQWVKQADIDEGHAPGVSTAEAKKIPRLGALAQPPAAARLLCDLPPTGFEGRFYTTQQADQALAEFR